MKRTRRDISVFSLSFLDCICCGFGAIILIFVLSKFSEPVIIEQVSENLQQKIMQLEQELFELRGETALLNRELKRAEEQLAEEQNRLARLQGDMSSIEGQFAASQQNARVQNIIEGELVRALQDLTAEMRRLLKGRSRVSDSVGGIPVDSEYLSLIHI